MHPCQRWPDPGWAPLSEAELDVFLDGLAASPLPAVDLGGRTIQPGVYQGGTIELTGTGSKLDAFLKAIDRAAILETVRTGASGIGRGERVLRV